MKKNPLLRRAVCFTGSAVLLAGLMTGFSLNSPGALALSANAETVNVESYYRVSTESLNVRSGPDIRYPIVVSLPGGTKLEVLETNGQWARISLGWVDSSFLSPDGYIYHQGGDATGYVKATALNVRTGPGTGYSVCGQLTEGYKVRILETRNGWGRINDGWISLQYVGKLNVPDTYTPSGNQNVQSKGTYKVNATNLNVRQGPGITYAKTGSLPYGSTVTVLEVKNGWGRINGGWISLAYVRGETGYENTVYGDVIEVTVDELNVRTGPGTGYQACGMMTKGYRATVLEAKDGWARLKDGWVCLDYTRWVR